MRYLFWLGTLTLFTALSGCQNKPPSLTIQNIDDYLDLPNTQYVDLRSQSEIDENGMIEGFSIIPFYEILIDDGLIHPASQTFQPSHLLNEAGVRALFDDTQTIVLICRAGNRTAYVKALLDYLGYEDVIDLGAMLNYRGDHLIFP